MVYLLLAVFSFVALAPLASVAWKLIDGNREALKTSHQERQLLLASMVARGVDVHVEALRSQLAHLAGMLARSAGRTGHVDPDEVQAVVSRGGRPDLAGEALRRVKAPTLLIVGGLDHTVLEMNISARAEMVVETSLEVVPGAGHLFEEPGALDVVASLATSWFLGHLAA